MIKQVIRKTTSMTALFSFIWLSFTGIIMYFMPPGRIAYWVDWHIFGLNKDNIGQTHTTVSMLFIVAMVLHVWLNFGAIVGYMRSKTRKLIVFTPETTAGLIIACVVFFGTIYGLAPFSTVNNALADFKEDYEYTVGNPPYGHAELSTLPVLADRMKMDMGKIEQIMQEKGFTHDNESTFKDIAAKNGMNPAQLYKIILPAKQKKQIVIEESEKVDMSKYEHLQGSGMGMKTVAQAAENCGITADEAIARLAKNSVQVSASDTLRDAAEKASLTPIEIYAIIDTGKKP
ncbi:DUF4405 domain-containing protein [Seleniivibrio sp.]|uniref:DUF4405 domain-containing protein n=1 Tax=Seleniivibrio sp. TaxID=2898801 RepID=UPI0025FAC997|nr:DUF4405 domain-containing protein [Seleniivibrio sp.]MCD8553726.1 DUF4405 domain-containing protein [Seleniivibrio sp.]